MKRLLIVATMIAAVASPAFAYRDQKLQEAVTKATARLKKGQPVRAVADLQKVVARLGTGEAHLALGRIQQQASLIDDAVASYAKARELEQEDAEVLAALARITLSTASAAEALVPAEKAVAITASSETLATLSLVQLRQCDLDRAREAADRALAAGGTSGKTSALAHLAQGEIQRATGHTAEAITAFRKALELDAKLVEARIGLAAALSAAGQSSEALAEARRAASEDTTSGEAPALQGLLMLSGHQGDDALWIRANQVAQEGAFRNPYSVVVQYLLGRVSEARPDPERAAERYRRALAIDPKFLPARLALTGLLVRQADVDTAFTLAQEVVKDAPWCGQAQFLLGRELLRRKQAAHALAALERATEATPDDAEAHALLATAAFFTGATDQAVAAYARALELRPDQLEWRTDYGLFLGRSGEYEAAAAELQKVVASPGYADAAAFVNLGWVYRNAQPPKPDESIHAYQRALEIDPEQAQAALGLGWACFGASRYDESIEAYRKAVVLDPALAGEAYDGIAWDYYFKGDMEKATQFLEKARATGRDDVRLAKQIERHEQKLVDDEEERNRIKRELDKAARCAAIDARLRSKDPDTRAPAVSELRISGCAEIIPTLTWMLVNDSSYAVKQAAAEALGKIGPAAREATPYLEQCSLPCPTSVYPTPEELRQEMDCSDLRQKCLRALAKVR